MNRRMFLTMQRKKDAFGDGLVQEAAEPRFAQRTSAGLQPYVPSKDNPWDYSKAAHLLRRCVIGATDAEIREAVATGLDSTLAKLFKPFTPDVSEIADVTVKDVRIRPDSAADQKAFQDLVNARQNKLLRWWPKITVNAPLSLQEKLTIFWHGHFTSEISVVHLAEYMLVQNQTYRKNMLGDFKQFVKEMSIDPAMLIYLDNIKNYKAGRAKQINENFARELMELFTCGITDWDNNPNYTQDDVHEGARSLSGWTIAPSLQGAAFLGTTGLFIESRWDADSKTFMGQTGQFKAFDVIDIIFDKRGDEVAKFICEKIYREFVYFIADRTIVEGMAQTFVNNNWNIRAVIEQLLRSEHFFDIANIGARQKSPAEYMLGIIRGWGITSVPDFQLSQTGGAYQDLLARMMALGQTLFNPPDVKGWRGGRTWISVSTLPPRQKFALNVIDGIIKIRNTPAYVFDALEFAKTFPTPDDAKKLCADMSQFLLNITPSAKESAMLLDTLLDGAPVYEWDINDPLFARPRIRKFMKAAVQLSKFQLF
ncbi:hypothetical protein MASR2M18_11640 [Ignavibacteria bacterium]|nr:DUF1800 domain-containing protein [Bacteroidota bacterium]